MTPLKEDSIIEKIPDEINDFYSDDDIFKITSWGADLSFRELIERYKEDTLLKPEMQRNYVWDKQEASRFIESILLGLPIPSIFLAKTRDEKLLIVDGFQRIMTVYDYLRGIFRQDGKSFKLTNSKVINKRWRGKAFNELSDNDQLKIKNSLIHAIIFVQNNPPDSNTSMYQIFERINTTGRTLFPQEIRNCVYQGYANSLLIELNKKPIWRNLYGLSLPDSRMRDIELILRFFTLYNMDLINDKRTSISLKKEMNLFMGSTETDIFKNKINNMAKVFESCLIFLDKNNEINPFHNLSKGHISGKYVQKMNPTIYDSIMLATAFVQEKHEDIFRQTTDLTEKRKSLLQDLNYQQSIRIRTTNLSTIINRANLAANYLYGVNYEEC